VSVRVKYNRCGEIADAINPALQRGTDEAGEQMVGMLKPNIWKRSTTITRYTKHWKTPKRKRKVASTTVGMGDHPRWAFYSRFLEHGTKFQHKRPVFGPIAHLFEARFPNIIAREIKDVAK
jgi:hypothetical protein